MNPHPITDPQVTVQAPATSSTVDKETIDALGQLLETVPKMQASFRCNIVCFVSFPQIQYRVVTMQEEQPIKPGDNKDNECKSVLAESDMLSMMEDKNDSDRDQSEVDPKSKTTKRCFNKKCEATKDIKKLKSRVVPAKFRNFCKACHPYYVTNQFCEFCEQVYDNSAFNEEDDNLWMGCDQCERWNHVQCEYQKRNKSAYQIKQKNGAYLCKECSDKKTSKNQQKKPKAKQQDYYLYQKPQTNNRRTPRSIHVQQNPQEYSNSNPNFVNIFKRPRQGTLYLDSFLNSFNNFKLAIPDSEIRQDLRRIINPGKEQGRGGHYLEKGKRGE